MTRFQRSIPRIDPVPGLDRAVARAGAAVAPKQTGQFPSQIRVGVVQSTSDWTAQVRLDGADVPATMLNGADYAAGTSVMCLTTPDRTIVLGTAGNALTTMPGWQPVRDATTGNPIVGVPWLQGIGQLNFQFDDIWQALRVRFVGGTDIACTLRIRVNDDSTASAHQAFGSVVSATGGGSSTWDISAGAWQIGPLHVGFANNSYAVEIDRSGFSTAFKAFRSYGRGGGELVQGGGLTSGLTDTTAVHSLRLLATSGGVFNNSTLVTIEGLRA